MLKPEEFKRKVYELYTRKIDEYEGEPTTKDKNKWFYEAFEEISKEYDLYGEIYHADTGNICYPLLVSVVRTDDGEIFAVFSAMDNVCGECGLLNAKMYVGEEAKSHLKELGMW